MLSNVRLQQLTAFSSLEVDFTPRINVLIASYSTDKTHLLKVCYAAFQSSNCQQ